MVTQDVFKTKGIAIFWCHRDAMPQSLAYENRLDLFNAVEYFLQV